MTENYFLFEETKMTNFSSQLLFNGHAVGKGERGITKL